MDIGMVMAVRNHPGAPQPLPDIYDQYIGDAVRADELGFDNVWLGEHRMSPCQWTPSPVSVMAAIAARTERIRIGPAVMCLPFHNPLRLAEDFVVLDNLSKGRMEFAFGVGSQFEEFRTYGVDPKTRLARTYESAAFIEKCFSTGETFDWEGEFYTFPKVTFTTRPVQERIPFYAGALGPKSLALAGSRGYNLISLRKPAYDLALKEAGHDPAEHKVVSLQMVHVAASEEQAWEESIDGLHYFVNFYTQRRDLHGVLPDQQKTEVTREMIRSGTLFVGEPSVGTPEQVITRLRQEFEEYPGTTGFALAFRHAGMRTPEVERSMRLFAEEVMPVVRSW